MSQTPQTPRTPPAVRPPRRRLARGEQRIAQLLDAAAQEFAESGYESATTNSIAARAGASPGTLYQFFPNKEAMAQALAERYLAELGVAFAFVGDPALAAEPVGALVDRVVDPVVAFTVANPAFKAVFAGNATPRHLAASSEELHSTVQGWMEAVVTAVAPGLPAERRRRAATVAMHILRAMLPLLIQVGARERGKLVKEFKAALRGYLEPLAAGPAA
ncbi:TetR/AcrR family transcriptional regulator [Actinacidiphila yeochonensis]|uniref:TetR/AcrR family transcriptional regulator n=1 Tax=Actinacidiphila yeochonensis TaxID=89050 RepID=UPI00055B0901|nr:TetR/AcrR family transcriptional regulator [Actinacidiphila yeochonensis]